MSAGGRRTPLSERLHFSDDNAKFAFGVLNDGRYWYAGNPVPGSVRNPLVFITSRDGDRFDHWYVIADKPVTLKYPGRYKGGVYGYPAVLVKDNKVYVVASVNKENIWGFVFDLPPLGRMTEQNQDH